MEVNKERLRLLVAALRSDRFVQGSGWLAGVTISGEWRHCCLGVACEVAIENGLNISVDEGHTRSYGGEGNYLPGKVVQWYGLSDALGANDPYLALPDGGTATASQMNDGLALPFLVIADAFERTFELLEEVPQ